MLALESILKYRNDTTTAAIKTTAAMERGSTRRFPFEPPCSVKISRFGGKSTLGTDPAVDSMRSRPKDRVSGCGGGGSGGFSTLGDASTAIGFPHAPQNLEIGRAS